MTKPPAPKTAGRFYSKTEREEFQAARRQFISKGKLDAMRAFLRRGKSLSPGVAEELAKMLDEGIAVYTSEGVGHIIEVKRIRDTTGRPPDEEREDWLNDLAHEVYFRVTENGVAKFTAIEAVRKEYNVRSEDLVLAVAELEEIIGPLPRDPRGRKPSPK